MELKNKPSKNFEDRTGDWQSGVKAELFSPWDGTMKGWTPSEFDRLKKGEEVFTILRERMMNSYIRNFFMEGLDKSIRPFDFHKEKFDTHSSLRKKSRGSAYDNY